jgi:menaquinone-dependent protoporphyrinogen IX oxidase
MNKNILVVYQSNYGRTKQYAEWIAEELGADIIERKQASATMLAGYDCVVYGGGLYAGGVLGVSLVAKNPVKNLVVFTVGLADPAVTDYSEIMDRGFPEGADKPLRVSHLRGGIDYKELSLIHKGMMGMVKKAAEKKSEAARTDEDKLFLETYGKEIDFTDRGSIAPLVEFVRGIVKEG